MDVFESQRNLTSRSDQFPYGSSSCIGISRPQSAALSATCQTENLTECLRSKSAEFFNLNARHSSLFRCFSNFNENKVRGNSSLLLSDFTHSSSNLLLHLLREPNENPVTSPGPSVENIAEGVSNVKANSPQIKQSATENKNSTSLTSDNQTDNNSCEKFSKNSYVSEWENPQIFFKDSKVSKDLECRSNRSSEYELNGMSNDFILSKRCPPHQCCLDGRRKFPHANDFDTGFFQKTQDYERRCEKTLVFDSERLCSFNKTEDVRNEGPKSDIFETECQENVSKTGNFYESFQGENDSLPDQERNSAVHFNNKGTATTDNNSKHTPASLTFSFDQKAILPNDIVFSKSQNSEKCHFVDHSSNSVSSESFRISDRGLENDSQLACLHGSDSTYDEIVQLLQTLEAENTENNMQEKTFNSGENGFPPEEISKCTIDNISDVFAYLEEVEKDETLYGSPKKDFTSPSLEKLLNKTSVELAHEVLSLEIQIEDQKKGLKLLKDTIADMKEAKRLAESEHQEILRKTNSDAEAVVKRHQKFIKQLLNEKKNLSETVSKLVNELKSSEEKHRSNIKAMEEKHLIEVKKAKDTQAVADKIKREKWMEMKTQKIKEMTVKGLEPELTRMAAQQQQELTELRNLHRAEIESIELKAARRTSELMDQLRTELTKEKETAITEKVNSVRVSMEREFEEERSKFHQNCQGLKQRIRKLEEKLSAQEEEFRLELIETKQEIEKEKQKLVRIHQENLEEVKRRHSIELNNLRETLESDKQICLKNHEKQLAAKLLDREAELHEQYKRERDREIDMVIEKFEKEQAKIQAELELAAGNKLRRVKEKLEAEVKELEENSADLKVKLSQAKSEVSEKEVLITELNSQIRQLQTEVSFLRKSCEKMTVEKGQLKETIRGEFESSINDLIVEKKNLQKEIFDLRETHLKELAKKDQLNQQAKNEMQKELTTVYSRIKAAISKKDKVVEALREENKEINERYRQLELMLDKQRRNLLLQ